MGRINYAVLNVDFELLSSLSTESVELPECTRESSVWPRLDDSLKYKSIIHAEKILAFIVTKLDEISAPMILVFGTALHEFRNGTDGPCLQTDSSDKTFSLYNN